MTRTLLSPEQVFDKYDDGTGSVSFEQFQKMLSDIEINLSLPKQVRYFNLCKKDDNGIDFEGFELIANMQSSDEKTPLTDSLPDKNINHSLLTPIDAFHFFDKDGNGELDEDEFYFLLQYLNIDLNSVKSEKNIFQRFQKKDNIDFESFRHLWLRLSNTRKELQDRNIEIPPRMTTFRMTKMLNNILLDEEKQEERRVSTLKDESDQLRRMQALQMIIDRAKSQAKRELAWAIDANGSCFVFGNVSVEGNDVHGDVDLVAPSRSLEGSIIHSLWCDKLSSSSCKYSDNDERQANDSSVSLCDLHIQECTAWVWGRCPRSITFDRDIGVVVQCENDSIYSWKYNNHWLDDSKETVVTILDDADRTKGFVFEAILKYYGAWTEPAVDHLQHAISLVHSRIRRSDLFKSLQLRGKNVFKMDKQEMIYSLFDEISVEIQYCGDELKNLEIEILHLRKKKQVKNAKRLSLQFDHKRRCMMQHGGRAASMREQGENRNERDNDVDKSTLKECPMASNLIATAVASDHNVPRNQIPVICNVMKVSCGSSHLALIGDFTLYTMGSGSGLGLGANTKNTSEPVIIESLKKHKFVDVSCGYDVTLAITAIEHTISFDNYESKIETFRGGCLYVAGPRTVLGTAFYEFGQYTYFIGHDSEEIKPPNIKQIAAGFAHQAALSSDGKLYCWGENTKGCCGHNLQKCFIPNPSLVTAMHKEYKDLAKNLLSKHFRRSPSNFQFQPFVDIDLGGIAEISEIVLWNRNDTPSNPAIQKNNFTKRLFPCWLIISQSPFGDEHDDLENALDICTASKRFCDNTMQAIWKTPRVTLGRYIRIQLEGLNILEFDKIEVFGSFDILDAYSYPSTEIHSVSCGKRVTGVITNAISREADIEISWERAIAANPFHASILGSFGPYIHLHDIYIKKQRNGLKIGCILCMHGELCPFCKLKKDYEKEILWCLSQKCLSQYQTTSKDFSLEGITELLQNSWKELNKISMGS